MKKLLIGLGILLLLLLVVYKYVYQEHRNIQKEDAAFVVTADTLGKEFLSNTTKSESLYLNKTIEVSGIVTELKKDFLILDQKVFCDFEETPKAKIGDKISIKGRCIGYDDLMEQVKLDQCTLISKN
ncbi:MAG TPA: hypothetical protein VFM70_06550 [Salinimicrobium sp.]|nr:hypothetical protein [Salinimicrobium sp.]